MSEEARSCVQCGYESTATECPQCGGAALTARSARSRGWVMFLLGLVLFVFMGVVIIKQAIVVYHSGEPDAKVRFTAAFRSDSVVRPGDTIHEPPRNITKTI